jgi:hypothetical protein
MCADMRRPAGDSLDRLCPERLDVSDAYAASRRRIFFLMNPRVFLSGALAHHLGTVTASGDTRSSSTSAGETTETVRESNCPTHADSKVAGRRRTEVRSDGSRQCPFARLVVVGFPAAAER